MERIGAKSEFVVTHLDTVQALTAAGQGDVLNKPERTPAETLKFSDSLWDRGFGPYLTGTTQIVYFPPYMQNVSAFNTSQIFQQAGAQCPCILPWEFCVSNSDL